MKVYWILAVFATLVLGAAAVWMGGLNQDEGWYLYAANLVAEGQMPYRDFFYTQGPLLPLVYSAFTWVWKDWGLLGARLFNLALGLGGLVFAVGLARRLVPSAKNVAAVTALLLMGCNLYHLYYLAIPKTYALATLFVLVGFYLLSFAAENLTPASAVRTKAWNGLCGLGAGLCFAFAAGTRISLGAILCVVGLWLLCTRRWRALVTFCLGGFGGLALVYVPFLTGAFEGLVAAQAYHAMRGGGMLDITWIVGSLSRLVRWYLPVFIVLGLGVAIRVSRPHAPDRPSAAMSPWLLLASFLAVFLVQMAAPFPYEDYQVPIIGLLVLFAESLFLGDEKSAASENLRVLLVLGLCFASSFGSSLLEKWSTNGQDRFWSIKKNSFELAQLRDVARRIEALDPGGKELFTQDVYLAIETRRKVPKGFEMGPFAVLSDADYERLAAEASAPVAALSGYSFAVEMPKGVERSVEKQMACFTLLKKNYSLVDREEWFGQNGTTLLILKHK